MTTTTTMTVRRLTERERFMLLRRRAGVTQPELGAEVGLSQSRISAWERGCGDVAPDKVRAMWAVIEQRTQEVKAQGRKAS